MTRYKRIGGNRQILPEKWTLANGTQTGNFSAMSEEVHNREGFFQCLPDEEYDPAIENPGVDTLYMVEGIRRWQRRKFLLSPQEAEAIVVSSMVVAIQSRLDQVAVDRGYDNIVNACGYAAAPNPFQAESCAFVSWRGNVWAYSYQALADVKAGRRPTPSVDEMLAEIPVFIVEGA